LQDSASQAEGGGDESKKGENDGEKSETNKEKSKKKGGIDLSKYGMKDKGENFWSSDEDEDEGKNKFKFKIKSEAEAAKEKEEKARSRTASSVSLGAPPLAAPQQTPSRRRGVIYSARQKNREATEGRGEREKRYVMINV